MGLGDWRDVAIIVLAIINVIQSLLIIAILVSWGIAFFEYMIQVPANRIGFRQLTLPQLKMLQELITLSVFVPFSVYYMRQPVRLYDKRVSLPPLSEITGSFLQHKTLVIDSGAMIPVVQTREPLLSEVDDFFDCIISGKQPRADGISGWRVVRLMEAADESIARDSVAVPVNFPDA